MNQTAPDLVASQPGPAFNPSSTWRETTIGSVCDYFKRWIESKFLILPHFRTVDTPIDMRAPSDNQPNPHSRDDVHKGTVKSPSPFCHDPNVQTQERVKIKLLGTSDDDTPELRNAIFDTRATNISNDSDAGDTISPDDTQKIQAEETPRTFACPFLKHNDQKFRHWKCCAWSGWPTVHRLK